MKASQDTIAAIATPLGRGGVGIVRVSGTKVPRIAEVLLGSRPTPRYAHLANFSDADNNPIDTGIALFFPAPRSFTGEDVLELQGHGGPVIMDQLLLRVVQLGARLARPGEFSERAFLNGKLDLVQAEAVADMIAASSVQGARSAMRSLQGEFSQRIHSLVERLIEVRMYVEAAIDFPEEEIDFLADASLIHRVKDLRSSLVELQSQAEQGALLRDGISIVIVGQPNVGKSRLLNALAGRETAIVTDLPGTTRDVLREQIHVEGMPVHVIDTAGLRESDNAIEREGMRRAWREIEQADRVLLVVDDRQGFTDREADILARLPDGLPCTVVRNKIDLSGAAQGISNGSHGPEIRLSALDGTGIDLLHRHLREIVGYVGGEGTFLARRRHLDALTRAEKAVVQGVDLLVDMGAAELLAEELRQAQQALGEITGEFTSDDLLGKIFTSFCIGK